MSSGSCSSAWHSPTRWSMPFEYFASVTSAKRASFTRSRSNSTPAGARVHIEELSVEVQHLSSRQVLVSRALREKPTR